MKRHEIARRRQKGQQRREIAVTDERLPGALELLEDRAAAAAGRCHSRPRTATMPAIAGSRECSANGVGAHRRTARDVSVAVRRPSRRTPASNPSRRISAMPQVELFPVERAGWSDDGETAPRLEGARLQHQMNRAISSAMARCSSRPSRCDSACALERPCRDAGSAETAPWRACWRCSASSTRASGKLLAFDSVDERLERRRLRGVVAAADQDAVAACANRENGRRRDGIGAGDGLHLEIVAQDHALEFSSSRRRSATDAARQRGGPRLVERRHEHVGGHHRGDARLDGRLERHELDLRGAARADARRAAARGGNPSCVSP